jgi:hypothetical protein
MSVISSLAPKLVDPNIKTIIRVEVFAQSSCRESCLNKNGSCSTELNATVEFGGVFADSLNAPEGNGQHVMLVRTVQDTILPLFINTILLNLI